MHASDTIDVGVVKSGDVWCEFDEGKHAHLRAGDFIVQNGTRHRWVNRSDEPCEMTFVIVGATAVIAQLAYWVRTREVEKPEATPNL